MGRRKAGTLRFPLLLPNLKENSSHFERTINKLIVYFIEHQVHQEKGLQLDKVASWGVFRQKIQRITLQDYFELRVFWTKLRHEMWLSSLIDMSNRASPHFVVCSPLNLRNYF